jgi:hypothetical protein
MAEKRMLSRRASRSKKLSLVSYQTEALYYRAIPYLDDAGRITADPEDFRADILPLGKQGQQVPLEDIESCIQEMYEAAMVGLCSCEKTRCMEYANFLEFQVLKKDRTPQITCKEPAGFHWKTLEDNGALREEKRREENLREGEGETRARATTPTTPIVEKLISKAREIKGWAFSEEEDAEFFPRLLADYPEDLVEKVIEDLRTYQEKPDKHYSNLHSTLRNWCKQETRWREDRGNGGDRAEFGAPTGDAPLDSYGNPMVRIGEQWISRKEFDHLLADGKLTRLKGKWRRKGEVKT